LNALPGPGVQSAVLSLAAVCETHGLGREVQVLQTWLSRRGQPAASAGSPQPPGTPLPPPRQILERAGVEQRLVELTTAKGVQV
jgi:hypothetical protein